MAKNSSSSSSLWSAILTLLCRNTVPIYPDFVPESDVPAIFADFFRRKVLSVRESLSPSCMNDDDYCTSNSHLSLPSFSVVTISETVQILKDMNSKSCFLDPVPTWLVKLLIPEFAPIFSRFANLSLTSGVFPDSEKRAVVLLC